MAKNTRVYQPVAAKLGFAIDETSGVIYGTKEGYEVLIYASDASHPTVVKIAVAVRGPQLTPEQLKQAAADMPDAAKIEQQNNCIIVYPKNVLLAAKLAERVEGALHSTIAFLQQNNFAACCQVCGKEGVMSPVNVADRYLCVCDDCFANLQQELEAATHAAAAKKENVVAGFVGALVGSLIGALCIVVVSQLGYVASYFRLGDGDLYAERIRSFGREVNNKRNCDFCYTYAVYDLCRRQAGLGHLSCQRI